jgi:hypothetical protein
MTMPLCVGLAKRLRSSRLWSWVDDMRLSQRIGELVIRHDERDRRRIVALNRPRAQRCANGWPTAPAPTSSGSRIPNSMVHDELVAASRGVHRSASERCRHRSNLTARTLSRV